MDNVNEASINYTDEENSNGLDKASDGTESVLKEEIKDEEKQTSKRKLSSNSNSEDDDSKVLKLKSGTVDEIDQTVADDNDLNSCNEDEDSIHSEDSINSTDDPQVLDDILSVKKMELLQHPQVIAFLREKMDQMKKKGK